MGRCFVRFDVLALTVPMMFRAICPSSIPVAKRLSLQSVFVCGLALWNLGCGAGPKAEFKLRETTNDLIPKAKTAVKATLEENFGNPSVLVAWDRFPVNFHGGKGTVASIEKDDSIIATIDGDADQIRGGAPILWVTGALATEKPGDGRIESFDPVTKKIVLADNAKIPAVGDRFIVSVGENLQFGRQVYMRNCMHCHGVAGDGAGPTAEFLNPRPRDYRNGVFKFTSTRSGEKPARDDLHRIVMYGIPGTYMPSFLLLGERETKAVVEYVRWLSIRGEFEKRLVGELSSDFSTKSVADTVAKTNASIAEKVKNKEPADKPLTQSKALKAAVTEFEKYAKEDYPGAVDETANFLADAWTRADAPETAVIPSVHRVEDTAESRERGRVLFMSDKTKCYTCHGPTGRGDGGANDDFWPKPGSTEKYSERGLHDEWGFILKPRNLTLGQYRGGRRPVDLFRRMYAGIKGTPMPAFGGTALKDPEIWDLVNYVMSLPYNAKQPSPDALGAKGHVVTLDEKVKH